MCSVPLTVPAALVLAWAGPASKTAVAPAAGRGIPPGPGGGVRRDPPSAVAPGGGDVLLALAGHRVERGGGSRVNGQDPVKPRTQALDGGRLQAWPAKRRNARTDSNRADALHFSTDQMPGVRVRLSARDDFRACSYRRQDTSNNSSIHHLVI